MLFIYVFLSNKAISIGFLFSIFWKVDSIDFLLYSFLFKFLYHPITLLHGWMCF